jgi:hypothetical protein
MITTSALEKIHKGILYTEEEDNLNHEDTGMNMCLSR